MVRARRWALFAALVSSIAACSGPSTSAPPRTGRPQTAEPPPPAPELADLVLRGGVILTQDPDRPEAQALAVKAGRILKVGSADEIASSIGPSTEVVDLQGGVAVPGFIDCHSHIAHNVFPSHRLPIAFDPTKRALIAALRAAVSDEPELPLVARGWVPMHYLGTRQELDAVSRSRPILVDAADGKAMWLNTAAIEWLALSEVNPRPDGAPSDRRGNFAGNFMGSDWTHEIRKRAAERSPRDFLIRNITKQLKLAASQGKTTVHNFAFWKTSVDILAELALSNQLPVRVREFAFGPDPAEVARFRAGQFPRPELFRMVGVKYFLDGAPLSGNGAYLGIAHPGAVAVSPEEMRRLMAEHTARGEQMAFHAAGQLAVRAILDAVEATPGANAQRHRIEHADVIAPEDEPRLRPDGVMLSINPSHFPTAMPSEDAAPGATSPGYDLSLIPPLAEWGLSRHVHLGIPVGLGIGAPLVNIAWAMRGPNPADALTFEEALAAHTRVAAYVGREEASMGSLREGMYADITILARDPRGLGPDEIEALEISRTIMAGRTTFDRAAAESARSH